MTRYPPMLSQRSVKYHANPNKRLDMDEVVRLLEAINTSKGGGMYLKTNLVDASALFLLVAHDLFFFSCQFHCVLSPSLCICSKIKIILILSTCWLEALVFVASCFFDWNGWQVISTIMRTKWGTPSLLPDWGRKENAFPFFLSKRVGGNCFHFVFLAYIEFGSYVYRLWQLGT